ncbi:hypothetical protein [Pseudomonas zeae]|uniref:hypothetical protein n=1 Tax=Pseudomonas zeae TaxID=2745510 RepID=UPI0039E119C7
MIVGLLFIAGLLLLLAFKIMLIVLMPLMFVAIIGGAIYLLTVLFTILVLQP